MYCSPGGRAHGALTSCSFVRVLVLTCTYLSTAVHTASCIQNALRSGRAGVKDRLFARLRVQTMWLRFIIMGTKINA